MLVSLKGMFGLPVVALDGKAGKVNDFLFDDQFWSIRYVVAETGSWLHSRSATVPAVLMLPLRRDRGPVQLEMTVKEVLNGSATGVPRTVSGRYRVAIQQWLFMPHRWRPETATAASTFPQVLASVRAGELANANLRSVREVIGYRIQGLDRTLGTVDDFRVDETWTVRGLSIRQGVWPFRRLAELRPNFIEGLSWLSKSIAAVATNDTMRWQRSF